MVDQAKQNLPVKFVDKRKPDGIAVAVEVGAGVLRLLFTIELKDDEVDVIEQAVSAEVATTFSTLRPACQLRIRSRGAVLCLGGMTADRHCHNPYDEP